MIFNAATLARGWLAVATASGKDGARPQLDRTIHIEAHPHGIRLVATDSYMLLHTWIPTLDEDDLLAQAPDPDEAPTATAVVIDQHGRAKSLCAHLLTRHAPRPVPRGGRRARRRRGRGPEAVEAVRPPALDRLVTTIGTDNPYLSCTDSPRLRRIILASFRDGTPHPGWMLWHAPPSGGARPITADEVDEAEA